MIRDALLGSFKLPVYFDYPATRIWALSGALLAARLRLDPTGVGIIALVTAAGGGLLRDGLFFQAGPPALTSQHARSSADTYVPRGWRKQCGMQTGRGAGAVLGASPQRPVQVARRLMTGGGTPASSSSGNRERQ